MDDDAPNYDEEQRRAAELQMSPTMQKVARVAGGMSPDMVDEEGMKTGFAVTLLDLVHCIDGDEIDCKTMEASAALYGMLALAMHSSIEGKLKLDEVKFQ